MDAAQVLAFRLARSGLARRAARTPAEAAACPVPDSARDTGLLALGARCATLTRDVYDAAVEDASLVVAYALRGAIHVMAPEDADLYGRALLAADDGELGRQLGAGFQKLGIPAGEAVAEVTAATRDALRGARLDRTELHEALRRRVRAELMPWCAGCESHHVAPMLWRYATVAAGARLDARRRYTLRDAAGPAPDPAGAVRRFLTYYGPATRTQFAEWAGLAPAHARRLWDGVAGELEPVGGAWLLAGDRADLESPPAAEGVRLIPPGDPFLQKPTRALIAPEDDLRKRLFRPVGSPGAVLSDGRLAGLWRAKVKGAALEIAVELLGRLPRPAVEEEAERVARLRGAGAARVTFAA